MTPTQRSLKQLREDGWHVEVVEQYNAWSRTRKDLFGFADLLAIKQGHRPLLVQVTAQAVANRKRKIEASPLLDIVQAVGFDIHVHGWRRPLKNGKPHGKYIQRVVAISS